jgi:hypothetical protein
MKHNQQNVKFVNKYFGRTYQGEGINYIEETEGQLFAYEFECTSGKSKPKEDFFKSIPQLKSLNL